MAKKWEDLVGKMSPERQAKVRAKTKELLAEMPLHRLRQAMKLSQEQLAEQLDIPQSSVSKIEHNADMLVSTLRRYVEAMGGSLDIVAHMPEGDVRISRFDKVGQEEDERELVPA